MKIYISNYLSGSISIIDIEKLKVEKEIKLEENIYPHYFCIDEDNDLIYIPSSNNGILYIVDLRTDKVVDTVSIGGSLSQIALNNEDLFLANEDSDSIYILNKKDLNPVGIISVDNMPHGFDINRDTNKIYVPCIKSIVCIDASKECVEKKVDLDFKAWHIKLDTRKKEIYVSTLDGKLVILDETSMSIKRVLEDFLLPVEICFNYSQNKIYMTDLGHRNVRILDYETGQYIGSIDVDGNPQGLEISKDDKLLFVSDTQRDSIKVYDTSNNVLIKEVKVGKEPTTIICV